MRGKETYVFCTWRRIQYTKQSLQNNRLVLAEIFHLFGVTLEVAISHFSPTEHILHPALIVAPARKISRRGLR